MAVLQSDPGSLNGAITELSQNKSTVTSATTGAETLTAAMIIDGLYVQSGTPGAHSKTLPTAALIVAAIQGCAVGTTFRFIYDNGGDNTTTFLTGSGVTLSGTATVATSKNREFTFVVTNVTSTSEAVRCIQPTAV
jgi:hypothetical protein